MGRDKGNKAELEVARLLQDWWRQLEPNALFVRTPLSGGWLAGRDHFQARGDLMTKEAPLFPWLVEVKRRERWTLQNFEQGKRTAVWDWWWHACEDAKNAGREPMLWFRKNGQRWIILVPEERNRLSRRLADFTWDGDLPGPRGAAWRYPKGFWEDRFLSIHPRQWL